MGKLSSLSHQDRKIAGLGLVLIAPALFLCSGGILQSLLGATGFNDTLERFKLDSVLFNPALLLGGLFLALVLNLIAVAQVKIHDGRLTGTLQLRGRLLNLGLLTGIGLLVAIIFLYMLAENFQIFAGQVQFLARGL